METLKQTTPKTNEPTLRKPTSGFESRGNISPDPQVTESSPGQEVVGFSEVSTENQPGQSGRDSSAAGGSPGTLGNLPPMQNRPFTPVGKPNGGSRNPSV